MSATDYTLRYLAETEKIAAHLSSEGGAEQIDRMVGLLRDVRGRGGRPREPRGERLPQNCRYRVLLPKRQCLRADGPHQ